MDVKRALDFASSIGRGALVTLKRDGRPQVSNVMFAVGPDELLRVSVTDGRAKTANMRRDPRVAIHMTSPDFWSYVALEGDAELTPVAEDPADATVDELVTYYRRLRGEHDDWDEYRQAMVADRRLVARLRVTHAYGLLP